MQSFHEGIPGFTEELEGPFQPREQSDINADFSNQGALRSCTEDFRIRRNEYFWLQGYLPSEKLPLERPVSFV